MTCAIRELQEEVRIAGEHSSWGEALISRGGYDIDYLTQDGIDHFRARFVYDMTRRTVEFYFRMALHVSSFDAVQFSDNEAYGRTVALLTAEELKGLAAAGQLTSAYHGILRAEGLL